MSYLLTLPVSPRGEDSWSRKVLDVFTARHRVAFPDVEIRSREVYDLPHISHEALVAGRTSLDEHTPAQQATFALQHQIVDEVLGTHHLVIATPMYNWGVPSALKAWVDHLVNRRTYYGAPPPFVDKEVTVIVSSGGLFSEGERMADDGLRPWLRILFAQLGCDDISFINCDPTGPMDRGVVDPSAPNSAWTKACDEVDLRIAELA